MDRRERLGDAETSLLAALQGMQAGIWTALPAVVQKYDASKMTVEVEVTIQMQVQQPTGAWDWVTIKPLVDCPVIFPGGGGFTLTFPIAAGDECLVVLASRCIDAWWQSGGVQPQADLRMHDLSDGFAIVGPRSQPRVLSPAGSGDGVELRNDVRTAYVRIDSTGNIFASTSASAAIDADSDVFVTAGGDATVTAAGIIQVQAPSISLIGNVAVTGNLTVSGSMSNAGINIGNTHIHNKNGASSVTLGPQ